MSRMRFRRASSTGSREFTLMMPAMPHIVLSPALAGSRDERTAYNCCRHLAWQHRSQSAQASYGHGFETFELEGTLLDELYEAADRHLIQPAFYLAETSGPVGLEIGAPAQESRLGEEEMGPRENREQMPAKRMEPRWPERREDTPARLE